MCFFPRFANVNTIAFENNTTYTKPNQLCIHLLAPLTGHLISKLLGYVQQPT